MQGLAFSLLSVCAVLITTVLGGSDNADLRCDLASADNIIPLHAPLLLRIRIINAGKERTDFVQPGGISEIIGTYIIDGDGKKDSAIPYMPIYEGNSVEDLGEASIKPASSVTFLKWVGLKYSGNRVTPGESPKLTHMFPKPGKYKIQFVAKAQSNAVTITVTDKESVFGDLDLFKLLLGSKVDLKSRQAKAEKALLSENLDPYDKMCLLLALGRLEESKKSGLADREKQLESAPEAPSNTTPAVRAVPPVGIAPNPDSMLNLPAPASSNEVHLVQADGIPDSCSAMFKQLSTSLNAQGIGDILKLYDFSSGKVLGIEEAGERQHWDEIAPRLRKSGTTIKLVRLEVPGVDDDLPDALSKQPGVFQIAVVEFSSAQGREESRILVHKTESGYYLVRLPWVSNWTPLQKRILDSFDPQIRDSFQTTVLIDDSDGKEVEASVMKILMQAAAISDADLKLYAVTQKFQNVMYSTPHKDRPVYTFQVTIVPRGTKSGNDPKERTFTVDLVFDLKLPKPKIVGLLFHDANYDPQALQQGKFSNPILK